MVMDIQKQEKLLCNYICIILQIQFFIFYFDP
jgi:hypothetical protein